MTAAAADPTANPTSTSTAASGSQSQSDTGGAEATLEAAFARADEKSKELQEQRGAGSGEYAVATRTRDYNQDPVEAPIEQTKWPTGEIDKGRLDPEAGLPGLGQLIAHRDRRAYLVKQAEQNEAANDELNFIQVELIKRLGIVQNLIQDPDVQREESMVSAVADLKLHDPEEILKTRPERQKMREDARREALGLEPAPESAPTTTPPSPPPTTATTPPPETTP
jgi:hypothetical protein